MPRTLRGIGPRSPDLHYVPYGELAGDAAGSDSDAGVPNVVVDGSPTSGTLLCLSHWPGIGSPAPFAADLSAEMAFLYLDAFDHHPGAEAVSNNHFDCATGSSPSAICGQQKTRRSRPARLPSPRDR